MVSFEPGESKPRVTTKPSDTIRPEDVRFRTCRTLLLPFAIFINAALQRPIASLKRTIHYRSKWLPRHDTCIGVRNYLPPNNERLSTQ
jgi:hypothetical protein